MTSACLIVDEDLNKTKVRAKIVDSLEHEISVTRKKSNTYTYGLTCKTVQRS